MGAGASSQASFEQMLACTMILGEAMVQGLDPRFVRFPDMYRLYDFHIGPKKPQPKPFQGGNMVIFVHSPDDDGKFQQIELKDGDTIDKVKTTKASEDDTSTAESDENLLVVFVGTDKIILDKATLNQPNFDNWTPLHSCCHTLNAQEAGISILQELVAQKADLNLVTKRGPGSFSCGWTPLHIACAYGLETLSLKLIRAGANVNVMNSVKWTPLYDACHRGYSTVARELLKAGAKHDVICPEFAVCPFPGQHPLAEAARQGHIETVKILLEWGVDKNAVNKLGWTALHEAAYHSRLPIVRMLVVYGADVFVKTEKGSLAKDLTIHSEIRTMLEDLCQHGPASSPKKDKLLVAGSDDGEAEVSSSMLKKSSPAKTQSVRASPLSRKEEYALLGDLPSLRGKAIPSISIQDVDALDEEEEGKADDKEDNDDKETNASSDPSASSSASSPTRASKSSNHKKHKKKSSNRSSQDILAEFKCAVSLKLLKDPLRSPYGHVFERHVVEAWFRDFGNRCPLTGEPLTIHQLAPDDKLKAAIREWKHGGFASSRGTKTKDAANGTDISESKGGDDKVEAEAATASPETVEIDPYDF
uniref:U-box domain-containing protein n=1 Tax=Globisporangium ultimum (strain ATCC 200006 / CBS 805.95 / DAOM BR144) TaxID=431595 RepID=K3X801_GLOUD